MYSLHTSLHNQPYVEENTRVFGAFCLRDAPLSEYEADGYLLSCVENEDVET